MSSLHKRDDIQWLRALAILAVLGFHIWPEIFPYGYFGVDIFFVISGYLMTQILILNKTETLYLFYSKRIKRIFPTCLLIITIFVVLGYFLLIPSDFASLKKEALWSMFFVNNFSSMFKEKKYFELVSGFSFFLHTWSLAVEIQFYFIAPFLIRFLYSKRQPIIYILIFIAASTFLQSISSETISFGLMICRIWQFLIGTLAFCCFQKCNEKYSYDNFGTRKNNYQKFYTIFIKLFSILSILWIILICFSSPKFGVSIPYSPYFLRNLVTQLSGLFIFLNSWQSLKLPNLLNKVIVYIGDASYSIYLIHWPFLMFFKYYSLPYGNPNFFYPSKYYFLLIHFLDNILTLLKIFVISILIHEGFEKIIGRKSWKLNAWIIAILYTLILCFCLIDNKQEKKFDSNNSLSFNPVNDNENEAQTCGIFYPGCEKNQIIEDYITIRPDADILDRYCSYNLSSKSKRTVLIAGNSFTFFQINGILKAINESKPEISEAFVITHPGCSLMIGKLNEKMNHCKNFGDSHDKLLEILRPDVIIHSSRVDHFPDLSNPLETELTKDETYQGIKEAILHISSFTGRLIIIEPTPILNQDYLNPSTLAQAFLTNNAPKQFDINLKKHHQKHLPSWKRVKEAARHCSNCILIPTEKLFCTKEKCPVYDKDTKLARYCDTYHITPRESLRLIPALLDALGTNPFD